MNDEMVVGFEWCEWHHRSLPVVESEAHGRECIDAHEHGEGF